MASDKKASCAYNIDFTVPLAILKTVEGRKRIDQKTPEQNKKMMSSIRQSNGTQQHSQQ